MRMNTAWVVLAAAWFANAASSWCQAEVLGDVRVISGGGCRFPDVAYNNARGEYLVVWADYTKGARGVFGRRLDSDSSPLGDVFRISRAAEAEALFPAVAYNARADEYLVTFDTSRSIGGQRVRGSDGALLGDNFVIGKAAGGIRSALAWSSESDNYLVAYYAPGGGRTEIFARRVDKLGLVKGDEMNLSRDANYSGYPAVAYSEAGDQFLITWDHEPSDNVGNIRGQRVSAASGRMLGEPLDIATSGTENRSTIAYDNLRKRWLVQYNESATRGLSYNQSGRFVGTDGTLEDSIAIARTAAFEGDTLFGGDLAFTPGLGGRFFSSFASESDSAGMSGQELLASGAPAGTQIKLGTGPYTCLNNAADTRLNRFLTVWEGLDGKVHFIHARLFESRND